jgi:hypothetical protein
MKTLLAILLLSSKVFAQSIIIPTQTITAPITFNGTTGSITITIPAQTVPIPASVLPTGLSWAGGVFTVNGNVVATSVALTGGPTLPTCVSNLFLWQMVSGSLQPFCYVAPTLTVPPITVTQASTPINTFTFTP